jgi:hypothetical protein
LYISANKYGYYGTFNPRRGASDVEVMAASKSGSEGNTRIVYASETRL